ncbi:uncharacterized protein LOC143589143 [Bidens hawaiensis]|uniref:uncharacterized protein LOC143589143 n=1 Tax=Bidens hawaiensis TaxID=980011 RepID=UPI00404A02DC
MGSWEDGFDPENTGVAAFFWMLSGFFGIPPAGGGGMGGLAEDSEVAAEDETILGCEDMLWNLGTLVQVKIQLMMEIENNVYHDAENETGQESDDDDDPEHIFSGKIFMTLSFGTACEADETDVVYPRDIEYAATVSDSLEDSQPLEEDSNVVINEQQIQQHRPSDNQMDDPILVLGSQRFGNRIILAIQRLELTKNDLRKKLANEARGNTILQASLERRKHTLHERRVALEQDVSRLQEQLQAERELRSVLEVGLNMSSGPVSGSHNMDPKMRAELEEIVIAEADVARLKQKVAELHQQLYQQRHCHYDYQHDYNYQRRVLQQDFDSTIAYINHERKQRSEETSLGAELRNIKGQTLMNGNKSRQPTRFQFLDPTRLSDSKTTKTSTSFSVDEFGAVDYSNLASTSGPTEVEFKGFINIAASKIFTFSSSSTVVRILLLLLSLLLLLLLLFYDDSCCVLISFFLFQKSLQTGSELMLLPAPPKKPLQTGSELMLLPAPKVVTLEEESEEEYGMGRLDLNPAPAAAYIAKLKRDQRQDLMLLEDTAPKPSSVATEEEKESGFRYSIHPSWEVTEQEESDMKSSSSVSSKSAYVTPPILTIEATNAASLQHDGSNTSTADSSLLSGSSQTQKQIKNPTKAVKRSAPIASVPKQPKQDPVKTETKPKRDPATKLKSDIREDVKLVPTARKPSWVVAASSRTQKRIDDSRNPTKGVKRSGRTVFVTKQPKQSLVKTETKPKNDFVAKLKCDKREDVKLLPTARKVMPFFIFFINVLFFLKL